MGIGAPVMDDMKGALTEPQTANVTLKIRQAGGTPERPLPSRRRGRADERCRISEAISSCVDRHRSRRRHRRRSRRHDVRHRRRCDDLRAASLR